MNLFFKCLVPFLVMKLSVAGDSIIKNYQVIDWKDQNFLSDYVRSEVTIQIDNNKNNRFQFSSVTRRLLPREMKGIVLLLPGGGSNFDLYENADDKNYFTTLAGYLAARNYAVYGYSPRIQLLNVAECMDTKCKDAKDWGFQSVIEDSKIILQEIKKEFPNHPIIIGGFSQGAMSTLALANALPSEFAGMILWEGLLYSKNLDVIKGSQQNCVLFNNKLEQGEYLDIQTFGGLKMISQLAQTNPNRPSPIPGVPSGVTNLQVFLGALTGVANPPQTYVPNYQLLAGNPVKGLDYSDLNRVYTLINRMNNVETVAIQRDIACSLAGERQFTNQLNKFNAPVLAIKAGHGFGQHMNDNLELLGSYELGKIQYIEESQFGHADFYANKEHLYLLEKEIHRWLYQNIKGRP